MKIESLRALSMCNVFKSVDNHSEKALLFSCLRNEQVGNVRCGKKADATAYDDLNIVMESLKFKQPPNLSFA